jgi:serine/threonine-protein kinase
VDSARWQLLRDLFEAALSLPDEAAQRRYLQAQHPNDASLVEEVLNMLQADRQGGSLLDRGVEHVAGALLHAPVPPETAFGPYHIERLLGEGGMGVVYLAQREDLGSRAAIKVLRDAWLSPARRERFTLEQRVLAQLNHPGIAQLYDAGVLPDGTPWFAMEFVQGVPLTAYCRQQRCTVAQRLQLFRQACEAVRFAHAHAVIHRDIKPSNILVKSDGGVRLLDFGIAKQLDDLVARDGAHTTLFRPMTPAYAAPEQFLGAKIGVHTDVYSLGVVLYQLLTGHLPFDPQHRSLPQEAMLINPSQAVSDEAALGDDPSRAAWADLDVLCLTALHTDPARRYSSVEALIRDIDHYLRMEPLDARPDGWSYHAGKFLRRHWQVVSVSATAALLILGLSIAFTMRLSAARDAAQGEATRAERVQQLMTRLFEGGDALAGPASDLKVIEVLDRGAREVAALSSDPGVQAELLYNIASIYQTLRQPDKADTLLNAALELRTGLYGPDSAQVAECLVAIGLLRLDQARLDEAEQAARRGYALTVQALPGEHPQVASASLALGRVLRERGQYDEAIAILTRVLQSQSNSNRPTADRAAALSALAEAHYSAGHYEASDQQYRQVLAIHREQLGQTHPLIAEDLGTLAAIQQDLGYYDEAERLARQALQIIETYHGPDSPYVADHLTSLGRALTFQDKLAEAIEVLERARVIQERVYGDAHPVVAEIANEIGIVLGSQDRFGEAALQYARAADIYQRVYGEKHLTTAVALSNVAYMRMQQGDYTGAETLFRHVIDLFTATLSADNLNTGIAHVKLGRTLLRAGRHAEAAQESRRGYDILIAQTNPSTSFLRAARQDLAAAYDALGQPEQANRFRLEGQAR